MDGAQGENKLMLFYRFKRQDQVLNLHCEPLQIPIKHYLKLKCLQLKLDIQYLIIILHQKQFMNTNHCYGLHLFVLKFLHNNDITALPACKHQCTHVLTREHVL